MLNHNVWFMKRFKQDIKGLIADIQYVYDSDGNMFEFFSDKEILTATRVYKNESENAIPFYTAKKLISMFLHEMSMKTERATKISSEINLPEIRRIYSEYEQVINNCNLSNWKFHYKLISH